MGAILVCGVEIVRGEIIFKMSGSGNDFVFIDGRASPLDRWTPERIRQVCARGTGVGADGLIVLEPGSAQGHVRFNFFNNDGIRAGMCGNGALCATRLAAWLELAPGDGMVLETDAGPVSARCLEGEGEQAEIEIPVPAPLSNPDIELGQGERSMWLTNVGVPHLVVLVEDVGRVALETRGRELRSHPGVGADGANVNFVANGGAALGVRTYERGVEAETLACGTGAVACVAAMALEGAVAIPCPVHTASGETLTVAGELSKAREFTTVRLTGQGRMVLRGLLGG